MKDICAQMSMAGVCWAPITPTLCPSGLSVLQAMPAAGTNVSVGAMQCSLDSAPRAKSSSDDEAPDSQHISSPVLQQPTLQQSSAPPRRVHVPMDPVLQAEMLRAHQELEALKRAPEEELVFSQTGASSYCLLTTTCFASIILPRSEEDWHMHPHQ